MKIAGLSILSFCFFTLFVNPTSALEKSRIPIKNLMHQFHHVIFDLQPYVVSEDRFKSPEGQKAVGDAINGLIKTTEDYQSPKEIEGSEGYRIHFELLKDHLLKTRELITAGQLEYARLRFNGTTNLCIACHTQTPNKKSSFGMGGDVDRLKDASFDNAEFLFITRRFDHALDIFDQLVRKYPTSGLKSDRLNLVYRRKLAIFARVKREPRAAIENLKLDLKNNQLPQDVRANIKDWISGFTVWSNETSDLEKLSDKDLIPVAEKMLGTNVERKISPADPSLVKYLRLSGILYERVNQGEASTSTPEFMYLLGLSERKLSDLYWYSVADIYWKECVVNYAKSPTAKKCFTAYEESITQRFSGRLPDSVKASLEALRSRL